MTSDDSTAAQRTDAWAADNAEAISERRRWIETHAAPLADVQVWMVDNRTALAEEAKRIAERGIPGSDISRSK